MKNISKRLVVGSVMVFGFGSLSSCVPLAAGAAGGYILHQEGYRFQNPVVKEEQPASRAEVVSPER